MPELRKTIGELKEGRNDAEVCADALALLKDYKDCVNELCLQCGQYRMEYEGACDCCRWQKVRRE